MTDNEVTELFGYCAHNKGTVKAWPDALGGIVGLVEEVRPPFFCKNCSNIEPTSYLNVLSKVRIRNKNTKR